MANVEIAVPTTLDGVLERAWLEKALAPVSGGSAISSVEVVEVIRTMATKVRFRVTFADSKVGTRGFCLKGFLDVDAMTSKGGATTVLEADFYAKIASELDVRVPACLSTIIDRTDMQGLIIMRDLIVDGARFCSALEAFTPDQAAKSLEQIAHLHAGGRLLDRFDWIQARLSQLAQAQYVPQAMLQELLNGPRGEGFPTRIRDAGVLIAGARALAALDAKRPQTLVHGDAHAGNIYETQDGPGLIDWQLLQRGGWSLDVAYHICAVLDVKDAESQERRLLGHYLETARGLGVNVPDADTAWAQYRESVVYGYYLWAITRRVDPAITNVFVNRLGNAVRRHGSYDLLGV